MHLKLYFIKKLPFIALIASCALILNTSCHKFSEDPFISLKKPWRRLTGIKDDKMGYVGIWKITSYKINGTEHFQDFDSILAPFHCRLTDCLIYFYNTGGKSYGDFMVKKNFIFDKSYYDIGNINLEFTIPKTDTFLYKVFHPIQASNKPRSVFFIKELYNKDLHLQISNLDIYFRRQD